jgi:uncharacterized protein YlxP (DUF503 family)
MVVGSLRVRLLVRESYTLKDKRQVVRSMKDRLRNSFNIAIAEVDAEDDRQMVVLGVAAVANEHEAVRSLLDEVARALKAHPVAEFIDQQVEIL